MGGKVTQNGRRAMPWSAASSNDPLRPLALSSALSLVGDGTVCKPCYGRPAMLSPAPPRKWRSFSGRVRAPWLLVASWRSRIVRAWVLGCVGACAGAYVRAYGVYARSVCARACARTSHTLGRIPSRNMVRSGCGPHATRAPSQGSRSRARTVRAGTFPQIPGPRRGPAHLDET